MDELEEFCQAMQEQVAAAAAAAAQPEPLIKPGDVVIGAGYPETGCIWLGEPQDSRFSTYKMGIWTQDKPELECPVTNVAPLGTPLADAKDERLHVEQMPKKPAPWLAGKWRLRVPQLDTIQPHERWFATKKDAVEYGRVWLAIIDFHNAAAEAKTDRWKPLVDAMSE